MNYKKNDWLDEFFDEWHKLTPEQRQLARLKYRQMSLESFDLRNRGVPVGVCRLRKKKKKKKRKIKTPD